MQSGDQLPEPRLKELSLPAFFAAHPQGQLRHDHGAGVAARFLLFQPRDHTRVTATLRGLAQNVRVEQPAHSLSFLGSCRLRGGKSSIGTGQLFSTSSQSGLFATRRRVTTSSSASKLASNSSPGVAGASAAGMLTRRLESRVTIMVGLSHAGPRPSTESFRRRRFTFNKSPQ